MAERSNGWAVRRLSGGSSGPYSGGQFVFRKAIKLNMAMRNGETLDGLHVDVMEEWARSMWCSMN